MLLFFTQHLKVKIFKVLKWKHFLGILGSVSSWPGGGIFLFTNLTWGNIVLDAWKCPGDLAGWGGGSSLGKSIKTLHQVNSSAFTFTKASMAFTLHVVQTDCYFASFCYFLHWSQPTKITSGTPRSFAGDYCGGGRGEPELYHKGRFRTGMVIILS